MKQITGGVTAAKGFQAASTEAGIKYKDRKDMATRGRRRIRRWFHASRQSNR